MAMHVQTDNEDGSIRVFSDRTYSFSRYSGKRTITIAGETQDIDFEKEIKESIESSPQLRAEIRRTFSIANKRLKRLQNTDDVLSPALAATVNSKFLVSNANGDWDTLVKMYGDAVAFLRQPTSTVTGAREFTKEVKRTFEHTLATQSNKSDVQIEHLWESSIEDIQANLGGLSVFSEKIRYEQIVQEVYQTAIDTAMNRIEKEAIKESLELQSDIDKTASDLAEEAAQSIEDGYARLEAEFYKRLTSD